MKQIRFLSNNFNSPLLDLLLWTLLSSQKICSSHKATTQLASCFNARESSSFSMLLLESIHFIPVICLFCYSLRFGESTITQKISMHFVSFDLASFSFSTAYTLLNITYNFLSRKLCGR